MLLSVTLLCLTAPLRPIPSGAHPIPSHPIRVYYSLDKAPALHRAQLARGAIGTPWQGVAVQMLQLNQRLQKGPRPLGQPSAPTGPT